MEQKSYKEDDEKLRIVSELLRGDAHVRGIAKRLGINHMTVSRKIRELSRDNVTDYRKEGKNKVYFLKKTAEARMYSLMSENYKFVKLLRQYPHLRKIVDNIHKDVRIKMALLFGSYVKGTAKRGSDIDVYIETTERKIKQDIELIDSKLNIKIGAYDRTNPLIKEIEKNHVVIKGAEEYYEKNKLFD